MLTDKEVRDLFIQLVFEAKPIGITYSLRAANIQYIAQNSSGWWMGFAIKEPYAQNGVWFNGTGGEGWRKLAVRPLHEGHDEHYYEVPRS